MRTLIRPLVLALMVALAPHAPCEAQQQPRAGATRARVPVLVAIAPELDGTSSPFRLRRIEGNASRDVILLASDADAAVLTQAVEALMLVRHRSGDEPGVSATFRVRQPQRQRVLPWAERVLRDTHAAAPREIPGVGRLQAVQIWLPRATRTE